VRLAEGDDRGPDVGDLSTTPEALSGRLDGLMERLRRVLDRDHVLENHDLRQTLTQLQSALAAKRGEVLSLRVEQERLTQGLAAVEASQRQLKTEVASRNERFCGLQQHMKELEAENRQLINAQLTSKPQVKERVGPELFTFITGGSGRHIPLERWSQLLRPAPLAIGAALGLLLSLAGLWLTDYRLWVGGLGGGRVAGLTAQGPASFPLGTPSATTARTVSGAVAPRPVTTAGGRVRTQRDALRDGGLGPELVQMAGGTFLMGTNRYEAPAIEKPAHRVNVSRFLIGRYEVTFDQYDAFAQATGRALPGDQGWGRAGRPVINVTWDDAQAYTQWISTQSGRRYRLPTEAEWEYAMAGGRQEIFWWGSAFERGREVCFDCGTRWDGRSPAPVGSAAPNPLGLYDMGGNVMEWVGDCLKTPDATAPVGTCELRMVRGGAFNKPDDTLHSTARRALAARDRFPRWSPPRRWACSSPRWATSAWG